MSYKEAKELAQGSKLGFVKFIAMDASGQWRGFTKRPVADKETGKWVCPGHVAVNICMNTDCNQLWLNSLHPFSLV